MPLVILSKLDPNATSTPAIFYIRNAIPNRQNKKKQQQNINTLRRPLFNHRVVYVNYRHVYDSNHHADIRQTNICNDKTFKSTSL